MKNEKSIISPIIAIIMGSKSDYEIMQHSCQMLDKFKIPYETKIVSAHRTPEALYSFAKSAKKNGLKIIIAGAGGAAHLPGMVASLTTIPVLGVPVTSKTLNGLDSLLSIAQMPAGIPVATFAIGEAGAKNAALFAVSILAGKNPEIDQLLKKYRDNQTKSVATNQF